VPVGALMMRVTVHAERLRLPPYMSALHTHWNVFGTGGGPGGPGGSDAADGALTVSRSAIPVRPKSTISAELASEEQE